MEVEESPDLPVAARYLETLSNNELCTFCIGDQEDMHRMIEIATDKEGAEAAHRVLDDLFMAIGGLILNQWGVARERNAGVT